MITLYKCEVCGRTSQNQDEISECENQVNAFLPPIGMIYRYCNDILFVVTDCERDQHLISGSTWAARGGNLSDNGESDRCALELRLKSYHAVKDFSSPEFVRCLRFCERQGFKPSYFDGVNAIKIPE